MDAIRQLGRQGRASTVVVRARARCSAAPATRSSRCSTTAPRSSTRPRRTRPRRSTLLDTGLTVLQTQAGPRARTSATFAQRTWPTSPARCRHCDAGPRARSSQGGPGTAREVDSLLKGLEPTLPVFLANLVTRQPGADRQPRRARADCWSIFPRVIAAGFTGTPGDGYGHVNLQFDNNVPPCTKGYKPPQPVAAGDRHRRTPILPGQVRRGTAVRTCAARSTRQDRTARAAGLSGRAVRCPHRDRGCRQRQAGDLGNREDRAQCSATTGWKWMLTGPVTAETDLLGSCAPGASRTSRYVVAVGQHRADPGRARPDRRHRPALHQGGRRRSRRLPGRGALAASTTDVTKAAHGRRPRRS